MDRLERIRGCLLAGAAGDALGYQVEFLPRDSILAQYGEGGVRTMGTWISDDTQMTLFTAEGLLNGLRHHMPMPDCVYQSYLDWYRTQRPDAAGGCFAAESTLLKEPGLYRQEAPGMTCLHALGSGRMGTLETPINHSKGCGGVMRAAPCGMLRLPELAEDEDAYALQGAMAAAVTHSHILGYVPAAMLADIVHGILQEDGRTLKEIILDSLRRMMRLFSPPIEPAEGCEAQPGTSDGALAEMLLFSGLIRRAVHLAASDMPDDEAIRQLGEGWVGEEALAIAVYCVLKHPADLTDCLSAAVSHDGDSDSTGAVAGNILGAWLGAEAIPADWLAALKMRQVVDEMAVKLYEAGKN